MGAEDDGASGLQGQQLGEDPAPLDQRRSAQIKAVQEQQIEGVVEHAGRVASRQLDLQDAVRSWSWRAAR